MAISKRKISLFIVVIILAWIGNIVFYKSHEIKGHLFMKHYYELNSGDDLELYYLENSRVDNNVEEIKLPEIDADIPFKVMEVDSNKYYKLKKLRMILKNVRINDTEGNNVLLQKVLENKGILLTKIEISTKDNKGSIVDIGEIYLKSSKIKESNLIFSGTSGSGYFSGESGSDYYGGSTTLRLTEDIKVTNVSSKHKDILERQANLTISKIPLDQISYPLEVTQEKDLYVSYNFKFNKEDIQRNYCYNINLLLEGEGVSGDKLETNVNVNRLPSSLYDMDIKSLLKESREE